MGNFVRADGLANAIVRPHDEITDVKKFDDNSHARSVIIIAGTAWCVKCANRKIIIGSGMIYFRLRNRQISKIHGKRQIQCKRKMRRLFRCWKVKSIIEVQRYTYTILVCFVRRCSRASANIKCTCRFSVSRLHHVFSAIRIFIHSLKVLRQPLLNYDSNPCLLPPPTIVLCTKKQQTAWMDDSSSDKAWSTRRMTKKQKSIGQKTQMQDRLVDHFIAINCIISVWLAKMWISRAHLIMWCHSAYARICLTLTFIPFAAQIVYSFHWIFRAGFLHLVLDFSWQSAHALACLFAVFIAICEHTRVQKSQTLAQRKSPRSNHFF